MDELKLNLHTQILKSLIAKIIAKIIKKQFGYEFEIYPNTINVSMEGDCTSIHIDADVKGKTSDIMKIIKDVGKVDS